MTTNAGLAVIGDEVLLGEVADENISLISSELFRLGTELKYACVLPDDTDLLLEHLGWMRERYQWVITTGGIGATHDDITRQVVAGLTGASLVEHEKAVQALEKRAGSPLPERLRPMCMFPEGAELIQNPVTAAPGFRLHNLIVLPGVPSLVRAMLPYLGTVMGGEAAVREQLYTTKYESEIAPDLAKAQEMFHDVKIGSYPVMGARDYRVRIVLRGRDAGKVHQAVRFIKERIL